jgi:hypothetical protein
MEDDIILALTNHLIDAIWPLKALSAQLRNHELHEPMSADIFESASAIEDDDPDDTDYAPIGKMKNPRAPAIRDIRDLSLDHLDDIHRKFCR